MNAATPLGNLVLVLAPVALIWRFAPSQRFGLRRGATAAAIVLVGFLATRAGATVLGQPLPTGGALELLIFISVVEELAKYLAVRLPGGPNSAPGGGDPHPERNGGRGSGGHNSAHGGGGPHPERSGGGRPADGSYSAQGGGPLSARSGGGRLADGTYSAQGGGGLFRKRRGGGAAGGPTGTWGFGPGALPGAVAAGIGFAAFENLAYATVPTASFLMRIVLAGSLHVGTATLYGWTRRRSLTVAYVALGGGVALHTAFNYALRHLTLF